MCRFAICTHAQLPAALSRAVQVAMCGWATDCATFTTWEEAEPYMQEQYEEKEVEDMTPALSVLFNAFIMSQVGQHSTQHSTWHSTAAGQPAICMQYVRPLAAAPLFKLTPPTAHAISQPLCGRPWCMS